MPLQYVKRAGEAVGGTLEFAGSGLWERRALSKTHRTKEVVCSNVEGQVHS